MENLEGEADVPLEILKARNADEIVGEEEEVE